MKNVCNVKKIHILDLVKFSQKMDDIGTALFIVKENVKVRYNNTHQL